MARFAELRARILSALVLLPPVIAAVWLGGIWFLLLVAAAAAVAGWEFGGLLRLEKGRRLLMAAFTGLMAFALWVSGAERSYPELITFVLAPPLALGILARLWRLVRVAWGCAGFAWIWLGLGSAVWLRGQEQGLAWVFWLLAVVWATDIAAYFVGRAFGGPRLAPRISPGKTWSGLIGGVIGAAAIGWLLAPVLFDTAHAGHALAAAGLAVAAQLGDLFESALKRHFAVKDSSRLIPGHGGLLDRIDGLLLAAPLLAMGLTFMG
ncbi:MAG: phosphatidate cytidylyltransferase [Alphaproteobacteria bacterium]|nr:MAG: phosphatidate cytidylyltransferase [Alphaproteobacteria bacterium]